MGIADLYKVSIFFVVLAFVLFTSPVDISIQALLIALTLFILFSVIYDGLRLSMKQANTNLEYAINYGLAIALFAGPIGALIYEAGFRITAHFVNKYRDTTYTKPFKLVFYNVCTFSFANSAAYFLYMWLWPFFEGIPFGFWMLLALLVVVSLFLSDTSILIYLYLSNRIRTFNEIIEFYKYWSFNDQVKTVLTNGLLYIFLLSNQWEYLIGLFMLNYFVSRSIMSKTENMRDKVERDTFKEMAYTDSLTGIPNRAFMDLKMKELGNSGETLGIVVADIDRFKNINDKYNHAVGDDVLRHFTQFLQSHLGEDDFVFRSGGEEFTLILRKRSFERTHLLLERIKLELEKSSVMVEFNGEEHTITYTCSFGLFYKHFNDHASIEKGYIYADNLLYQSKRLGRNRITAENGLKI